MVEIASGRPCVDLVAGRAVIKTSMEPGVNLLVGPNRSGKTALLSELDDCVFYGHEILSLNKTLNSHLVTVSNILEVVGPGSWVAIDGIDGNLSPHWIRHVLYRLREGADEKDLTIILTTHSVVTLNQFDQEPERVFVLGHDDPALPQPARVTDLHDEPWLAQSKLGSLYERGIL